MSSKPIGIFDSGAGGLTVFTEIRKTLPNENIIYLGDTKNFPYGSKSKEEIINVSIKNIEILLKKDVKIIVIACGTATSQAIDILKQKYNIPIVGIIDPTVEYVKKRNIKQIGVIATEGTIRSQAWEKQLKQTIPNIIVENKACPILATIAEEGNAESVEGENAIKEYMQPFKAKHIDKIILGCTHYPIYDEIIRQELNYEVELINSGTIVAKYLKEYLQQKDMLNKDEKTVEKIYLTKPEKEFKNIAKNIMKIDMEIEEINKK